MNIKEILGLAAFNEVSIYHTETKQKERKKNKKLKGFNRTIPDGHPIGRTVGDGD